MNLMEEKGLVSREKKDKKEMMKKIWFKNY
jgi:hypothetical protein